MGLIDRIRDAKRDVQAAALKRLQDRTGARLDSGRKLATTGPGSADSPMRRARMDVREAGFQQARALQQRGRLPIGIERKLGPTLDLIPFAPDEAARKAGRPVARLVDTIVPGLVPQGFATGFLVGQDLLLTNHHVFPNASDAKGTAANFLFEETSRGLQAGSVFELDPGRFFLSEAALDFALVAVRPRALDGTDLATLGSIALIEATPKLLVGQPVEIIQYPEGGPKRYATRNNRCIDILDEGFLIYETDTMQGSSGSPAFSMNWELAALHHTSLPMLRDGMVVATDGSLWQPGMPDEAVKWIANEGIRISALLRRLDAIRLPDSTRQAILHALLADTTDPIDDLAQATTAAATDPGLSESGLSESGILRRIETSAPSTAPGRQAWAASS